VRLLVLYHAKMDLLGKQGVSTAVLILVYTRWVVSSLGAVFEVVSLDVVLTCEWRCSGAWFERLLATSGDAIYKETGCVYCDVETAVY
jgi:cbb3-type cytochrome oxidase cytochrome c subunit